MKYLVTEVTEDTVTIWDGVSKDEKHNKPAGMMIMHMKGHPFQVDDRVTLTITKVQEGEVFG